MKAYAHHYRVRSDQQTLKSIVTILVNHEWRPHGLRVDLIIFLL